MRAIAALVIGGIALVGATLSQRRVESVFDTGEPISTPRVTRDLRWLPRVTITRLASQASRYDGKSVLVEGCFAVDAHHGGGIFDRPYVRPSRPIPILGGSRSGEPLTEWTSEEICGFFVGRVESKPTEDPLRFLCPDVCFVMEDHFGARVVHKNDEVDW